MFVARFVAHADVAAAYGTVGDGEM